MIVVIVVVLGGLYLWSSMQGSYAPKGQTGGNSLSAVLNIGTDNATLGNYLVASNGMTLYYFTKDAPGVSNCSGACAVNWPPYTGSTSDVLAGDGIAGTVSTITRADGTTQLTYNGAPLYFWSKDAKPGDTTGQNIGGVWFVVKP